MKSMGMFIIREWKKTLLLFTLFFVSFSLITTTFLLEAASERTIEKIKPEASGVITIKTDIIDYPERLFSSVRKNLTMCCQPLSQNFRRIGQQLYRTHCR